MNTVVPPVAPVRPGVVPIAVPAATRPGHRRPAGRFGRVGAVALLSAAAVLLTGCSGSDTPEVAGTNPGTPGSAADPTATATAAAASVAAVAPTAVPSSGAKVSGQELGKRIAAAAKGEGTVAFSVISTGGQALSAEGVAVATGSGADVKMRATAAGTTLNIIRKGATVFVERPGVQDGKPWIRMQARENDGFYLAYRTAYGGLELAGDVQGVGRAVAGMGSFTTAAEEPVDGVPTTKYVASPDVVAGAKLLPVAAFTANSLPKGAVTTVAVWVDGDGLLRRAAVTLTIPEAPTTQALLTYGKWGADARVSAPAAGSFVDGPSLPN